MATSSATVRKGGCGVQLVVTLHGLAMMTAAINMVCYEQ
jgi:hypothetical protein